MDTFTKVVPILGWIALVGCETTTHEHYNDTLTLEPLPQSPVVDQGWEPIEPAQPVAAQPVASFQQPEYALAAPRQTYVIQRGDTLWSIASRVYQDGQRWREIQVANPGLQPTRLRVGQEIMLP